MTSLSKMKGSINGIVSGLPPFLFTVVIEPEELLKIRQQQKLKQRKAEIELHNGPIDTILGYYDYIGDRPHVDVLETALARATGYTPEAIDSAVTEVVAHEFRHQQQHERYGKWMFADRIVLSLIFLAIVGFFLIRPWLRLGYLVGTWSMPYALLSPLIYLLAYTIGRLNFVFALKMAYRWSWAERDARRYARQTKSDPAWQDVVKVKFAIPPDQIPVVMADMKNMLNKPLALEG